MFVVTQLVAHRTSASYNLTSTVNIVYKSSDTDNIAFIDDFNWTGTAFAVVVHTYDVMNILLQCELKNICVYHCVGSCSKKGKIRNSRGRV
jgi:hypothetical protein